MKRPLFLHERVWETATTQPWEVAVDLVIPGIPKPQPRARFRVFKTRDGNDVVSTYHPKTINDWKAMAQAHVQANYGGPPLDCPLLVIFDFRFPKTQVESKVKSRRMFEVLHHVKPDLDNLLKSIKDALKGFLWRDDALISMCIARKVTIPVTETPCIRLQVVKL